MILLAMPETSKQSAISPIQRIINEIKPLEEMKEFNFVFGI